MGDVVTREYLDLTIQAPDEGLDARFVQIDTPLPQIGTVLSLAALARSV